MTNSDYELTAKKVIHTIVDLLDEEFTARKIDAPIENAADSFSFKVVIPISHSAFNRVIAAFVRHIYQFGLRLPRNLSEQESLEEAVFLLTRYYQGVYIKGYDGALRDATKSDLDGLELVLSRLADSIKIVERRKYVRRVFAENLDCLNWETRHRIAATYAEQNKEFLPPALLDLDPAQLTSELHDLIINHVSTVSLTRQYLGAQG